MKTREVGRGGELPYPLLVHPGLWKRAPQISMSSPTKRLSELCPFGFLRRLHDTGSID